MSKYLELFGKIRIHPLTWVVVAFAVATARFVDLSILFLIVFIHELGHGAAAAFFSWRLRKITLLPFGGVAEMDEHGNRPLKEEAIVTIAGPVQHFWLMGAAFVFFQLQWISVYHFSLFVEYNLIVLIFNMLPIWPLDGGKLLFLFLSLNKSFPNALQTTLVVSFIGICIFSAVNLMTNPLNLNAWVMVSFLLFSLHFEWKQKRYVFMRFLLERYYGKNYDLRKLQPIVTREDALIIEVLEKFQRGCKHPIIIKSGGREKGSLDENELLHAYFSKKLLTAKVGDLLYQY